MNSQYKKGVLELCMLSMLRRRDRYGYEVSEQLARRGHRGRHRLPHPAQAEGGRYGDDLFAGGERRTAAEVLPPDGARARNV